MKTTVKALLMSKLSDLKQMLFSKQRGELVGFSTHAQYNRQEVSDKNKYLIGFLKYIISKFPYTNIEINVDEEYERYIKVCKDGQ
jgi:hypothetical protein